MPREPWFKVKIGIRRSAKMAALQTDSARLGYVYLLAEAKVQRRMGVFENRAHFAEVLGRFGRFLPQYLDVGVIHEAPLTSCPDCARRHPDARQGDLVVHDYLREQRDPTAADRMEALRDRHGDADVTPASVTNGVTRAVTNGVTKPEQRYGNVTPTVTGDSRARATTATATVVKEEPRIYETEQETPRARPHRQRRDGPVDPSSNGNSPDHDEAAPW